MRLWCAKRTIAAQIPSPRGQFCQKRTKRPLLRGRGTLGGTLRDNLGDGNCESKIAASTVGTLIGIIQKVFSEKASAIARMRQKYVRNASKMHHKCVKMGLVLLGQKERCKMRPKCVKIASKCVKNVRNTFGGEHLLYDTELTQVTWKPPGADDEEGDGDEDYDDDDEDREDGERDDEVCF